MQTKKWKDEWDLSVLYKSVGDPQIEKDVTELEKKTKAFVKRYTKDTSYLKKPVVLKQLLEADRKIDELPGANKPMRYLQLLEVSGKRSDRADKLQKKLESRFQKLSILSQPLFLALGKIDKKTQQKFITAKELKSYKYFLEQFFLNAKHQLSEAEERILTLKSQTSSGMWVDGVEKTLNKKMVDYNGKKISLGEALYEIPKLPTTKRRKLYAELMKVTMEVADYAEGELNAFCINKKINDELRGFKNPYDTTLKSHETRAQDILPFTELITKNFKIAHKFYKIKKRMLGVANFQYEDRAAKIGKVTKRFTFDDSSKLLHEEFTKIDPKYASILSNFLTNGQIDAHPKKGKRGGAFQWAGTNVPTAVFLNHVNTFDSLTTYAHEMGHAFHSSLSKESQPLHYQGYSTAVAETASTFFENFAFERVFGSLSEKEKAVALHDKIEGQISTIFRQIAAFNFEKEMHEKIRSEGYMSHEEFAALLTKHMKSYIGPVLESKEIDGYSFISWPHFRSPFYVYSYAYGELISTSLYEKYKEDPSYLKKIEAIFEAGSSLPPHKIFKKAGIDTTKTVFFKLGLKKIEKDIALLEKLTK